MSSEKLLGNLKEGLFFVISAPAGTGKNTLVNLLKQEFSCVVESISYTTRNPRIGEQSGREYFFVSEEEFLRKVRNHEFLEHAKVFENYYGTDQKSLFAQKKDGKHVVLVIDTQGALQLRKKIPAIFIFIHPPSQKVLQKRLEQRNTETAKIIEERLSWVEKELKVACHYDYHLVNEDLDMAYQILRSIFIAEEHKNREICKEEKL